MTSSIDFGLAMAVCFPASLSQQLRTCYNCNQSGHFIKDFRRPPRLSAHRQPKREGTVKKPQGADHSLNGKC
jgi:hypothetical protein